MPTLRRAVLRASRLALGVLAPCTAASYCYTTGLTAPGTGSLRARFTVLADAHAPTPAGSRKAGGSSGDVCADSSSSSGGAEVTAPLLERLVGAQATNQFTQSGVTLMLLGAALAAARSLLLHGVEYCKRRVLVTAEIDSRDDAYRWVMHWLSQQPGFRDSRCVSVHTALGSTFGTSVPAATADRSGDDSRPNLTYLPAPGWHLLTYGGRWFGVSRRRSTGNPQMAANARLLMETLHLTTWGTSRAPLERLLLDAADSYRSSQRQRTGVWAVDQDGYWQQVGSRPVRPLSSVVLPDGQAEVILEDCREFLESEEWYSHHGIPWRRGYLLHGPPGSGKTSLVMGLAGALQLDIYVTTLSSPAMSDEILRGLLNQAAPRALLLLEDVDAAFTEQRATGEGGGGRLTFSGLLNAIDGVAAQEGRLVFMTTNHIERLNEALIRPGRVDVRCRFDHATREQVEQLFYSFYADRPAPRPGPPAAALDSIDDDSAGGTRPQQPPSLVKGSSSFASASVRFADAAAEADSATATLTAPLLAYKEDLGASGDGKKGMVVAAAAAAARARAKAAADAAALRRMARDFAAALATTGPTTGSDNANEESSSQQVASSASPGLSMAALQGYLMRCKRDPAAALAGAAEFARSARTAAAPPATPSSAAARSKGPQV